MDFNELVKKYHNQTATEEEIKFVEDTVMNARNVAKTKLNGDKNRGFMSKLKGFFIKLLIVIMILGGLFIYGYFTVSNYARENMVIGKSQADSIAMEYVRSDKGLNSNQVEIETYKRKLVMTVPFGRSYYVYQYSIKNTTTNQTYNVLIDSFSESVEYGVLK